MKKFVTIILLFLICSPFAKAQFKENNIKLNIFGLLGNQFQLTYERAISENTSVQLSAGMLTGQVSASSAGEKIFEANRTGFILIPEARYYFEEALKGAYVSGFFRYRQANWDVQDLDVGEGDLDYSYTTKRTAIGGGITAGYQFYIAKGLNMDVFIGPQYKSVNTSREFDDSSINEEEEEDFVKLSNLDKDGVGIRFGFTIGYAF